MTVPIGSVEDLDAAIAAGLLPDNAATRMQRAHLANPIRVHVDDFGACKPEFQKLVDESIPADVTEISLTGLGEVKMTLGAGGEIVAIAKGNGPLVPVSPIESASEN
jgi:hypothetical protein